MSLSVTYIQEINLQAQEALKLEMHAAYARYKRNGYGMSEQELKEFFDSLTLEFLEDDIRSYDPDEMSDKSFDPNAYKSQDQDQDLDGFEDKDA
jgi:hypothetical protein